MIAEEEEEPVYTLAGGHLRKCLSFRSAAPHRHQLRIAATATGEVTRAVSGTAAATRDTASTLDIATRAPAMDGTSRVTAARDSVRCLCLLLGRVRTRKINAKNLPHLTRRIRSTGSLNLKSGERAVVAGIATNQKCVSIVCSTFCFDLKRPCSTLDTRFHSFLGD